MDPVTIGIGLAAVGAASGLIQLYNSERERGATKDRLNKIERMFNEIVPPQYNISIYDDPALVKTIPPAAFDFSRITPESFASVGQYVPEVADFVREVAPQVVEASAAAQEGRGAQLEALRRYRDIAAGRSDPMFQQKMQEASDRSRIEAQGRTNAALQDAQRRGALDSGVQLAAQLQGGSEAMTRGALASQQAAAEAYRNQLMALDKSANLGGDIRSSEMNEAARNAGIINDFNQRTSTNYQNYLNQRANMANQAQMTNLDRNQRIADANVAQRNKFAVDNQNRFNDLMAQDWQMKNKERADKLAIQARKEQLMQQNYNNQMSHTGARAGVQYTINDAMNQATRDRNQAIQGLGEGVMGGMMYGGRNMGSSSPDVTPTYGNARTTGQAPYSPYYSNMSPRNTVAYEPYETDFTFDEYLRRKGQ